MDITAPLPSRPNPASRALRVTAKALPEHSRLHNKSLLLQTLFHRGAMSRADLARESGLTRVTVSDLVGELAAEGIVETLGTREGPRVGKPATLVDIRTNAFHIVALDLSADDRFLGAVTDLRGTIIHREDAAIDGKTGEEALELAIELCRKLMELTTHRVLGIGIGTPGIVDHEGVVREAPNLGWYGLNLSARMATAFGTPVYVGNDANAAALGVHTFRETRGLSLMVIAIEHGVGAGLIIGGALVEGEQFAAGEIGHIVVDENGDLCACGRRGCLELLISAPRLKHRLRGIENHVMERDAILGEAGRALGIALAPVISALNLNEVVISGAPHLYQAAFLDAALATIRVRTLSAVSNGLDLHMARGGEDLVLLGATVLVLSAELGVS